MARLAPSLAWAAALAAALWTAGPAAAQSLTVRSGTANDVAGMTPLRDQFREDLGGGTLPGANGLFDDGVRQRREINWDGVPAGFSAPNNLPANFFNVNSPRGAVFSTPGSGFMVSGATTDDGPGQPSPANFGNIHGSYTANFLQFSAQRLFAPLDSNVMDVTFFVPGTGTPAGTRGFGVVFTDVEQAGTTALQFFDMEGVSLGAFAAPPQVGPTGFSFLGAFTSDGSSAIGRVRITLGNDFQDPRNVDGVGGRDLVVMDDFLYGDPISAVPEPAFLAAAGGVAVFGLVRKRSRTRRSRRGEACGNAAGST